MRLLDSINSPEDIRKLNCQELKQLCSEIREYMIQCCSVNPGHLGASLGAVELAVALNYVLDTPKDKIIWDVGHQAYAHKIITGRREAFLCNRKHNGISGFPKMAESPYDAFGTGHASTSISAALGIATAAKIEGINTKVVAVIGDGAMTGGLAFEGLNNAGAMKTNLLVILNDNQISIGKNVGAIHNYLIKISTSPSYNRLKNRVWHHIGNVSFRQFIQKMLLSMKLAVFKHGSVFEGLGFRYFGCIDGNDIGQLVATLKNIINIDGPKLLHIRTVKGKGYKPAEENQSVWHAPGCFDVKTGKRIVSDKGDTYQKIFGEALLELMGSNAKIVAVTPAMLAGSSLLEIKRSYPGRCYDVGIAEQHAVTFSAGMAADGLLPFCVIYSSFMQRAFDEIIHDVALQNLKVVFCIDRAGLVGADGATHQGAFDLSYFRLIPNTTIAAPMNAEELRNMLYSSSLPEYEGAIAIRYPRGSCGGKCERTPFAFIKKGESRTIRKGERVAVISIGTIGNRVEEAIDELAGEGITPMHIDMRFLKPLDYSALEKACRLGRVITVEDGSIIGGLYSAVSEFVASNGLKTRVKGMGIPDKFIEQGTVDELITDCGFNVDDIIKEIRSEYL
ncbi:MAG: 1-deoxy-D-xylulose-5-phosphate synthase [Bacteroidales bacterium]|jgi:1-deoxy-D-xylulose-5-phosphate synthase|nr:1-deoxy-D-xylulose-5-phosphate synthase [Bacteroidales bacterium]